MPFVIDASVVLAWHFADEGWHGARALAREAARDRLFAPSYLALEVANGLLRGERMGWTHSFAIDLFLRQFRTLEIELRDFAVAEVADVLLPLAQAHGLKLFDAGYLQLAAATRLPIATYDDRLAAAARAIGTPLKEP